MPSTIAKGRIATDASNHSAPGPPGISPGPPPPAPVPTPFPYVAKSNDLQRGGTRKSLNVSGKALLVGGVMKMMPPCNKPADCVGIGDIVTAAKLTNMWAVVVSGEEDARAEGKQIAVTGSDVALNAMMDQQKVTQVRSKFLNAVDFAMMLANDTLKDWAEQNVDFWGDPVSSTTGEVIDWDFDLFLPGALELVWKRHYCSSFRKEKTPLGKGGWTHAFHQWIGEEDGRTVWCTASGRRVVIPSAEPTAAGTPRAPILLRARRAEIQVDASGSYRVRDLDAGRILVFAPLKNGAKAVLREIRDPWGNHIELRYEKDRLAVVVDTARREVRLRYDGKGRIVGLDACVEDKVCFTVEHRYTSEGELHEVVDAAGNVTRYGYDGKHRLIEKSLADGCTFRYAYDEEGELCVRAWSDEGFHPVRFEHQPGERTVTVCGTPTPREIVYDAKNAVTKEKTLDGAWSREIERDEDGLVLTEKDAAGETIESEYDERGHRVALTDAAGRTTRWEIEGDLVVKKIEPGDIVTTWEYDARGGVTRMTLPSGLWIGVERDSFGRIAHAHTADGRFASFTYDDAHNLVKRTDGRGAVTSWEYDALGRLTARTDPNGQTIRITNDALGRPLTFQHADGTTEKYTWDARNRVTSVEDRSRRKYTLTWTGTRSLKKLTGPDGQAWEYEVDVMERLVAVTSPRAERYDIRYDRAGRIREETTFDGSTFTRQYDRSGRIARVELPGESWLSYVYTPAGDVAEEDSPHGKRTFEWTETGRLTSAVMHDYDRKVLIDIERDAAGRVVAEAQGSRVIRFAYDKNGRLAERVLPDGQTTRYFYDILGDLVALDHAGYKVAIQRDASGREVRRHHYHGAIDILRAFDPGGRSLEQWVVARPDAAQAPGHPVRRRWSYDAMGRPAEQLDARWGREAYAYGSSDELLGIEGRFGARFDYDPSGAMIGAAGYADEVIAPWKARAGNVLLRTATHEYTYDQARRRRKKLPLSGGKPIEYLWDARSRLREVRLPSGERVCFWYDAIGRRTLKMIVPKPRSLSEFGAEPHKPRTVEYLWHGYTLAAELDSERGVRVFVHNPTTMLPVLQLEGGHVFAYVTDPLGTPRELLDEHGRIAWAAAISPFGKVLETYRDPASTLAASTPFRQLGHIADDETGLLCTLHRYFDPEVGRWLSIDPLLLAAGGNLFGLAKSPTMSVDPFGLGHFDVAPYGPPNTGFERHEPLQNSWLNGSGMSGRRTGDMSLGNPTIGLTHAEHAEVHSIVNGWLHPASPGDVDVNGRRMAVDPHLLIDLHAQAMQQLGFPQQKIDAVIAAAHAHAPKFVCT